MADQQYVVFRLHTEEYGIEIKEVQEIVLMQGITPYPQAADFIVGIINLRGKIIPIIDMNYRFNGLKTEIGDNSRIIVLDTGKQVVGIIVDEVMEVLWIKENQIEPPPIIVADGITNSGVKGIGKLDQRLIIILDLTKTFNQQEKNEIDAAVL